MPHPSKRKGNGFERELVNLALGSGLNAKRAYGSNGEALGHHAEVDLVVGDTTIQAKRRKTIAGWVQPSEHVDAVAIRQDHGEALIVLRYSDYLDLRVKLERAKDEITRLRKRHAPDQADNPAP